MKKWVRKTMAVALSGALLLGASGMAGATDIGRDTHSNFANAGDTANTGVTSFNLIKDYDSFDKTKPSTGVDAFDTQLNGIDRKIGTFYYI